MAKTSIIIPSRDERFLEPTIRDIMRNRRGQTEVIAVLDSDKWPAGWRELCAEFSDLHTIHNGKSIGMRGAINKGVASAISRGARYVMKSDGHCSFSEGFDVTLVADCEPNWVVVPRRGRLDPENWVATSTEKPDIDYHYLSFPDDPSDFGGPGLNGKVWVERAIARKDILIDEEMSSQGSCWFMHTAYFTELELMDEGSYGPFWNEFQEIGLKCWLSGGQVMVNKKAKYLHLHKGKKYGKGYRLAESALKMGRNHTIKWLYNEAWAKQTMPFKTIIERFWPVPGWPEGWESLVYGAGKQRHQWMGHKAEGEADMVVKVNEPQSSLKIIAATYGIGRGLGEGPNDDLAVEDHLQSLVANNSLDIVVNNSTICPGKNPHRGKKKQLTVTYAYNGTEPITVTREEKEWLIIGQAARYVGGVTSDSGVTVEATHGGKIWLEPAEGVVHPSDNVSVGIGASDRGGKPKDEQGAGYFVASEEPLGKPYTIVVNRPTTPTALNDFLVRRFKISPQRLRGPMPIEVPSFHRNDLAQLFAELGFKRGAEIGVAEGKYSEVLLKANPDCELLLVDPWHAYGGNPQNKTKEKNEFAYREAERKTAPYVNAKLDMRLSMDAVRDVAEGSLDFCYVDGHHGFDFVMQDLIEWSKRVRSGGLVTGDDYYALDEKRWGAGPVEAVQAYVKAHRIPVWYIFQGHKSVDFMWVKP